MNPTTPTTPPSSHVKANPNTPIHSNVSSSRQYSSGVSPPLPKFAAANLEMQGNWKGPVNIKEFLGYLPEAPNLPDIDYTPFEEISTLSEVHMYKPLIEALEKFAVNMDLRDSSQNEEKPYGKPDIAGYRAGDLQEGEGPTAFNKMIFFIECKTNPHDNPHVGEDLMPDTQARRATRGQLVQYATGIGATQFRINIPSILINKNMCTLYVWRRGNVEVSEEFDYTCEPHLVDFLWRLGHADDAARGFDTSASTIISDDDRLAATDLLKLDVDAELTKLTVNDASGDQYFIVGPFLPGTKYSPHGRGTRPYRAYDCQTGKLVLLKDTWRVEGYTPEHETLEKLKKHNVPNIPNVVAAGDVKIGGKVPTCEGARKLIPYRIVFGIIGKPLTEFSSIHQLIRAVHGAFIAHRVAVEEAKVLHRDISVGNILITETGGLLIDWEMAKNLDDHDVRAGVRTGTWQFMSARVLKGLDRHVPGDGIESFFHVLTWIAIRLVPNSMSPRNRSDHLRSFDAGGSATNVAYLRSGSWAIKDIQVLHSPLEDLLGSIAAQLSCRYNPNAVTLFMLKEGKTEEEILPIMETHEWLDNEFSQWLKETPKDNVSAESQELDDLSQPVKAGSKRPSTHDPSGARDSGQSLKRRKMT